ncbi:MAG: hypothetical protein Q9228_004410 [Teloschistes exilis]
MLDRGSLKSQFMVEDMMLADGPKSGSDRPQRFTDNASSSPVTPLVPLLSLDYQISIIAANSFFHLYNYIDQLKLAKRMLGSSVPGEYTGMKDDDTRYAHDVASFQRFWDRVAEEVGDGCRFRVESMMDEVELILGQK